MIDHEIRPMCAADLSFVFETSLKVRKPHGTAWREWLEGNRARMYEALSAPRSAVRVMEADGVLVGFAHVIGEVLQMVYVKRDLRGFGFGMELLGELPNPLLVHRPNACFRRWSYVKGLKWRDDA